MSEKYSVDDILNEVRRKKAEKGEIAFSPKPEKEEKVFAPVEVKQQEPAREQEKTAEIDIEKKPVAEDSKPESYDYQPTVSFDKNTSSDVNIEIKSDGGFAVDGSPEEKSSSAEQNKRLSKTRLLGMKTEELSALGENSDKAEAWETFVRLTEMREQENQKSADGLSQEIDDYSEKEDERSIRYDIKSLKAKVILRFWVCLVFAGLTGILSLINAGILSIGGTDLQALYFPAMFLLTAVPVMFCMSTVFGGLWSLLKFKPDGDSPIGFAMISVLIFNGVLMFYRDIPEGLFLYNTVAILGLAFNAWGKLCVLRRALYNFGYLTADGDKYAIKEIAEEGLTQKLGRSLPGDDIRGIACSKKVGFLTEFLNYSYSEDPADKSVRITAIISLFISILFGVSSYFITDSPNVFHSADIFVLATVIFSPFGQYLGTNIPLLRASKKALKHGGMLSGYAAAEDFNNIDAIIVDSDELFPAGAIELHGIKTFEGQRIDEAIIDAASVVVAAGTTLKSVFSDIIDDKKELLKPVDSLVYEDSMGVSGWVDSKRVLIGNRTLMENHNLITPSKDYEDKYLGEGNEAIYLANSGTLTAMFVVSYRKDKETANALYALEKCGVRVLVRTTDPNISTEKLTEIFSTDKDLFGIVPSALHKDCKKETSPIAHSSAKSAHTGRFPAYAHAVAAAINSKKSIGVSGFLSSACLILSYIIMGLVAIMGTQAAQINVVSVLIYQFAVLMLSSVLPSLRKY